MSRGRGAYFKAKYGGGRSKSQPLTDYSQGSGGGPIRPALPLPRTSQALQSLLQDIDHASYGAYKRIQGSFQFPNFTLCIDHVQSDPFASPSRFRVLVPQSIALFPPGSYTPKIRNIALCDYLTRIAYSYTRTHRLDLREGSYGWAGAKGGDMQIDAPGQEVLQRTSVLVDAASVELRALVGLPGQGRTILGQRASQILFDALPKLVTECLVYTALNRDRLNKHIECVEDQEWVRSQLATKNLIAFVRNGSILPRASGASDLPMTDAEVIPFSSPSSLEVELSLPNEGIVRGMGLPRGVVAITGGGFHGKSTLLKALERGVYNHVVGDGREFVITDPNAVKIRAEDGRSITSTDITPFITNLPYGKDTRDFSTEDASGSTSMAANIQEMLEVGATTLLYDEDTCATNFLIRSRRMQQLIHKSNEPITPLVCKIRQMFTELGVSSIVVVGGCGDYLDVADIVVCLEAFVVKDLTVEAREIVKKFPSDFEDEGGSSYGTVTPRTPLLPSQSKPPQAKSLHLITHHPTDIFLGHCDQLVSTSQTRCIASTLTYIQRTLQGGRTMGELVTACEAVFDSDLGAVQPDGWIVGNYARPRRFEIAAVVARVRGLRIGQ